MKMNVINEKNNEVLGSVWVEGKSICLDEAIDLLGIKLAQSAEDERKGLPCGCDLRLVMA